MYRIKLQSGEESEFSSFEELCFGVVSGIIGPDDEIYHARASKWLPIQTHPDYKRAAAQAPPPSPAMASQSTASPAGGVASQDPPDEESGQDLMTLLDLEELTAFDPGKVQESAPLQEVEPEAETAELEPIEAQEPEEFETNGHAAQDHTEPDRLDELTADTEDATASEIEEPAAELDAEGGADEVQGEELSAYDERPTEEPAVAELDIAKETEFDVRDSSPSPELTPDPELMLSGDEEVTELEHLDSDSYEAVLDQAESELAEADHIAADSANGSRDIDYVAAEDQDGEPMMTESVADPDTIEDEEVDEFDFAIAEDEEDEPVMDESVADLDTIEGEEVDEFDCAVAEDADDEPGADDPVANAEAHDEAEYEAQDLEDGDTDEDVELEVEPVAEAEAEDEVIDEAEDLDDDDTDEDVELEVEQVAQADDDDDDDLDDDDPLLGGPVVEIAESMDAEASDSEADDELEPAAELVATAEAVDPIDAFQPDMDDDPFRDTFSPAPELEAPRRFPVLPVAIAAGVVVMAALGWILMGASGPDEPVAQPDPQAQTAAAVPAAVPAAVQADSANLNQQSLAAEDPSEDGQRRYDEAYDRARLRLNADLSAAGFAAVFAPGNFASEDSMVTARAAIAGAGLAVTAYAGREQAIQEDFPDADPTGKESRAHRELGEDLLAVSQRIYGLLLANMDVFALRNGAMTITDPAVESEYARLLGEVDRLMGLAASADEERAATVRRIAAAIGNTRPPPLAELAPPPVLPTDL